MTREAILNQDALDPRFIKYNPCYYCEKTTTCQMECIPRLGFTAILEEHLTNFYKPNATEQATSLMSENAIRHGFIRTYLERR